MFTSSGTNSNDIISMMSSTTPLGHYYFPSSSSLPSYDLPHPLLPSSLPLNQPSDDLFFHQYHPTAFPHTTPEALLLNFASATSNGAAAGASSSAVVVTAAGDSVALSARKAIKRPAPKKDRHSKIFTAQGLRDRRVRLSIEIAREFFDLHDMLGFDKASKTLDWLLRKSKHAIRELRASKSLSSNNSELDFDANYNQTLDDRDRTVPDEASIATLMAKRSRAMARARARARTKEKTTAAHSHGVAAPDNKKTVEKCGSITSTQISSRFEPCPLRLGSNDQDGHHSDHNVVAAKLRSNTTSTCHNNNKYFNFKFPWISSSSSAATSYDHPQHELRTTTTSLGGAGEASSNNVLVYSSSSMLLQNWDINSTVSPRLCVPTRRNS